MLRRPQFKPGFHVEVVDGEGAFLLSEQTQVLLSGRLYALVASRIDGRRSADEIVEGLSPWASAAEVYYTLARLEAKGYLVESDDTLPAAEAALWAMQDIAPATAARRLAETTV